MIWFRVRGTVIAWTDKSDESLAVVKVLKWGFTLSRTASLKTPAVPIPVFVLRSTVHDYTVIEGSDDFLQVGDVIEFVTCRKEQEEYASLL